MVVGTSSIGCQVVVIGGGPGGYLAAIRLAQLGKDVLLVEESPRLGGVCLNEGCIPSKSLIHAADFLEECKRADKMGINLEVKSVDIPKLTAWKDNIVTQLTQGVKYLVTKNQGQILHGRATFLSNRKLEVLNERGPTLVEFEQAVIATGSKQIELPELPVDGETVILAKHALSPQSIPARFMVIGGGYVGLEMGSVYQRFGAEVHIVDIAESLLPFHDPEVGETIRQRLVGLGITLHNNQKVVAFAKGDSSIVTLEDEDGNREELEMDQIMVSVGRKPNSNDIGLENLNVELDDKGFIRTNDRQETTDAGIYAIGDVTGQPMLAHKAYREAKVCAEVIAGKPSAFDNRVIPAVVYTDPEIAWAGLSEKEAREQGYKVVTGTFPFRASGRAMTLGATEGFVKSVGDADTKQLLGIIIVGKGASEMIAEAALAIEMGAFLDDLSQTIHPHPTLSEGLLESVEAALGEAVHIMNE